MAELLYLVWTVTGIQERSHAAHQSRSHDGNHHIRRDGKFYAALMQQRNPVPVGVQQGRDIQQQEYPKEQHCQPQGD